MDDNTTLLTYLWIRLPIILMFVNGFLVYRLLVVTRLTDVFVFWSLKKSRGHINRIFLFIISTAALLSFFIPNAVTVLALLPILKTIDRDLAEQDNGYRLTTALTLSAIYGANIGGMGSLIGSPANLLLIGALDFYAVTGRELINFFSWFLWSVPLVVVFVVAAWVLVVSFAVPRNAKGMIVSLDSVVDCSRLSARQKNGVWLFAFFIVFWIVEAIIKETAPSIASFEPVICLVYFSIFVYFVFFRMPRSAEGPLLRPRDIITGFPLRGILFIGFLFVLILVVRIFELDSRSADFFSTFIQRGLPLAIIFLLTTLIVIFLTEILSNTVVSTAFFSIAYFAAIANGMPPLTLMIAVSIASTCAFMTPIATPCNALAFGEMKGTSLRQMLLLGCVLNVIGALLMTFWLRFVIPLVYF